MTSAFIGEIRPFTYSFVPAGWLECNGTQYNINQFQVLYAVIGSIYGGDQRTYFQVPDLRGRVAVGAGQGNSLSPYMLAAKGGNSGIVLTMSQMPVHSHDLDTDVIGYATSPSSFKNTPTQSLSYPSRYLNPTSATAASLYNAYGISLAPSVSLASTSLAPYMGAGAAHENRQPYTVLRYCICATDGEFPPFN